MWLNCSPNTIMCCQWGLIPVRDQNGPLHISNPIHHRPSTINHHPPERVAELLPQHYNVLSMGIDTCKRPKWSVTCIKSHSSSTIDHHPPEHVAKLLPQHYNVLSGIKMVPDSYQNPRPLTITHLSMWLNCSEHT